MEMVTTGAIKCAKVPVKLSPPTNPSFLQPDALPVTQPTVLALKLNQKVFQLLTKSLLCLLYLPVFLYSSA